MQKYWTFGILGGIFLIAVITILATAPDINNTFSGMVAKKAEKLGYCVSNCNDYANFHFKQPGGDSTNIRSYTINEGDSFLVTLNNFTDNMVAIYRYDGIEFGNPKGLVNEGRSEGTGNYVKLSLLYAKLHSIQVRNEDSVVQKFSCEGKKILVPIVNSQVLNKEINLGEKSSQTGYYLTNIQIKPFENALNWRPYYSSAGFQLSDYNIGAVLVRLNYDPTTLPKGAKVKSSLLVDLDGNGDFGGDVSTEYFGLGVCSKNIYRGNIPGQKYTSYRGAGSAYE